MIRYDVGKARPTASPAWLKVAGIIPWLGNARRHDMGPHHAAAKASEWLLDNEFYIRRAARQVIEDMPVSFYRRLPALERPQNQGPKYQGPKYQGLPRILVLARAMLDRQHMQVSLAGAIDFICQVQKDQPLTIAELWAFPAMLRLTCLEILVHAYSSLVSDLEPPFPPTPGIEQAHNFNETEEVSRAISALIAISNTPWKMFFESVSRVEEILRDDPAGIYSKMDFETRDRYRKAVEDIALGAGAEECDIAAAALTLASQHAGETRAEHVGAWLIAEGRETLENNVGYCRPVGEMFAYQVKKHPAAFYFGSLSFFFLAAFILPVVVLALLHANWAAWIVGLALSAMPASIVSVMLTNWIVTLLLPPAILPKLDVEGGLDAGCESALVMPVIIRSATEVPNLVEKLETHWLTNPDPRIRMVMLSDLPDAPTYRTPQDEGIEKALVAAIRMLNRRYADQKPFILLHRQRRHNPAEGCWMGWERKRGKLEEFTAFILGAMPEAFALREGDVTRLAKTRYVVTLDADTTTPPSAVNRLIGTLAHPLNVVSDADDGKQARRGYTFLQPRVEISPQAGGQSLFTRLFTGDTAIDIYSRAVSDVYQDLFGEGIFIGKGVYDAAAFHHYLKHRVPENSLVSHDLFEGLHGRAALTSDIVFYEDFPPNYLSFSRRAFRWIRGDWQLLPWLSRFVPMRGQAHRRTDLTLLDRWKIIDNLRRSLIAPSLVLFAFAGWLVLPGESWIWTLLTVSAPSAYIFTDIVTSLARGRRRGAVKGMVRRLADHAGRWFLAIVFMAHEACVAVTAITKTLWRVYVSRRRMLQWTTAAHTATDVKKSGFGVWIELIDAPILSATMGLILYRVDAPSLLGAAPLLLLWFLSPEIARWISRPRRGPREVLRDEDRQYLRLIARKTWLFFETFAGATDNWLPPDNYQASPHEDIAHRTSPTNIGMLYLSALTALDLGHIGLRDLAARISASLDSLDRLETHQGHMVNWIETKSLRSLEPRYISTVDSGNLAVCLLTLREGCLEALAAPAMSPLSWDGLDDCLHLLDEAVCQMDGKGQSFPSKPFSNPPANSQANQLSRRLADLRQDIVAIKDQPQRWRAKIEDILAHAWTEFQAQVPLALAASPATDPHDILVWMERTTRHLSNMRRDLDALEPWGQLSGSIPDSLVGTIPVLDNLPSPVTPLNAIVEQMSDIVAVLKKIAINDQPGKVWLTKMIAAIEAGISACTELTRDLETIARRASERAFGMDFRSLYDHETRTFRIGYNLGSDRLDGHHYDLLASEARLASYFAIAKRDVPVEHWFHLGRPISHAGGRISILSWNGSMFEYLMPPLLLPSQEGRLLGQSERAAVYVQKTYAEKLGLPWGVSESGFAARDAGLHYQYQAFGVPGLGLKRDLSDDYVVAPYASALALAVTPASAVANLRRLEDLGMTGLYGFFEAIDFTPERRRNAAPFAIVRSHMAHHQGMIMAAIGNVLNDDIFVRRFLREPHMRTNELLMQERIPWEYRVEEPTEAETTLPDLERSPTPALHGWSIPETEGTQLHVIGNGSMASWITSEGGGALWWKDQSLTHWTGDDLRRQGDSRLYISEPATGDMWSIGQHSASRTTEIGYHAHKMDIHEHSDGLTVSLEITVAAGDDVEIRRITLSNDSNHEREFDLTSYAEVTLAPQEAHERHPAFSKLFIHSDHIDHLNALVFTRRPRRPADLPPVLVHKLLIWDQQVKADGFETDRGVFLGRHGDAARPPGAIDKLEGSSGWTLDPVMALRAKVTLEPGARVQLAFITIAAGSRETALEMAARYTTAPALDWAFEDAKRSSAIEAHRLGMNSADLAEAQALCHDLVFPRSRITSPVAVSDAAAHSQSVLWSLGISGDAPIIMVKATDLSSANLLPVIIRAYQWWRGCGLRIDLAILREGLSGYQEPVRELLFSALRDAGLPDELGAHDGIHFITSDLNNQTDRRVLENAARFVLDGSALRLADAVTPKLPQRHPVPRFIPVGEIPERSAGVTPPEALPTIEFNNSYGGFVREGSDYQINLDHGRKTPSAWCNILANDGFGTIVTESGLGFTWCGNSGEHRLTPWSNDPLVDPQGEALYIRDEESARIWSTTPLPAGGGEPCRIRHNPGSTIWQKTSDDLAQSLIVFVPPDAPVKIVLLKLHNLTDRNRRITLTYYAEWMLGAMPSVARPHVICGYDGQSQALMAGNGWNAEFGKRVAFLAASRQPHSLTCNRAGFLGRDGNMIRPAGLDAWSLDGVVSDVADPCAAFQVHVDLAPHESEDIVFVLGEGRDLVEATTLARHWADPEIAKAGLDANDRLWAKRLNSVQISTPDPAFNILVNRWLIHQTYESRILARAGFHQASGAFGFRDQLQDMLALLLIEPARVRAHILDCASRQFGEGDVLHWWHPPSGRGIRTHCSDDFLWLVYVTGRYVAATGDTSILSEAIPFLTAPPLGPDEEDRYSLFAQGDETATLFEHCRRAMVYGATAGEHGLPLMGTGDWNDGMDRVGSKGRGESVWLAWFSIVTSELFADLAADIGQTELQSVWKQHADRLRHLTEAAAWDGHWYVRAFADDGLPWGSQVCDECQIDSISQSWASLADGLSVEHKAQSLAAAVDHLVDAPAKLVKLLSPPFDKTVRNPGYISAYPPGIRENGGQYTHAAAWLGLAHAHAGDGDRAYQIFDLINPVGKTATQSDADHYRGEPYVLSGDVYGSGNMTGRAGWTWYTGAASWTWQLAIEGILGISQDKGRIRIRPHLPKHWGGAEVRIKTETGSIHLVIQDPDHIGSGPVSLSLDGKALDGDIFDMPDGGRDILIVARMQART